MPRITGKDAEGLMAAYAKVHLPKEDEVAIEEPISETPVENIQEDNLKEFQTRGTSQSSIDRQNRINALRKTAKPFMNQGKVTVSSNNSSGTPQPTTTPQATPAQQPAQQAGSGSRTVAPGTIGRLLPNHPGNTGGGQQARPTQQAAPAQQARPAQQAPAPQARPGQQSGNARSAGEKIGGAIGGGIDRGIARARGGLSALGNLAGRAVGGLKQGVQAAGNTLQKGVQGAKRIAGGVADAATGNLTDFDKRGGKTTGLTRVVTGGIDKLTGDRTDFDKRGVTPLNAGQRAQQQQQQKPAPAAAASAGAASKSAQPAPANSGKVTPTAAQTAAAKADTTSPAAKAGLSADMRAQAAAKHAAFKAKRASQSPMDRRNARLAAAKNKGRPLARNNRVTQVMDLESYDLFDDTVEFLISEGYVQDINEAISVMSEPEFREGFDEGMEQILTESSENNK